MDTFTSVNHLFNPVLDRQQTMLAYEAQYFPYWHINEHHKLVFQHVTFLRKDQVLNRCNADMTTMHHLPLDRRFPEKEFAIRWAYNNRPTELEWERIYQASYLVCDYRISPLIKDGNGRICLLSIHDKGYYQNEQT